MYFFVLRKLAALSKGIPTVCADEGFFASMDIEMLSEILLGGQLLAAEVTDKVLDS